ncbi:pentatricopeptide repeat-containing protein At1g80880, mitochondrial [Magnolia sinica]|uniref:pentatricopeptide repeat-containing protein At1g80880, mitochondrial n=1 Tax=Magnolia sinica TaxID=86752 RepID=UPI00265A7F03|nr:pentatricopeptide repeat-containing protein At1g80880, mitochondrial [Magnolia sinica]
MAFIIKVATRIRTRAPHFLFPLILHPPLPPFPTRPISSSSSSIPKTHLQNHPLFPLESSPNALLYESSDFESDGTEPLDSANPGLDGFLQILSQTKELSSNEDSIAFLEETGVRPTSSLVYEAMRVVRNDWKLAFLAFSWGEKCGCGSVGAWNLMIWILGKQRKFHVAWQLVRDMHRSAITTHRALLILIERYAAANDASKAIRTFEAMDKFRIIADSTAFYTLLRTLCKHNNIEEAEEFMFLNKKLFPLETESFNIILNGWCNIIVDEVEAKRVWREMSNCCITPDGTSYTHMICCFSKVGNLFESLRLYDEMKKRGWVPGLVVYNSLIYVLTKENCMKEARNLLHKIIEVGLKPDADTFNSIIYPLCEAQKLEEARIVLDEMVKKGLDPTVGTYHALANVEDMDGTLNLINRMREVGCGPDSSTYLIVLNKFFRWGLPENMLIIWTEMRKHDVVPDSEHYIVLVQGLATCGWLYKAREFYDEMKSRGFRDDPKIEKLLKELEAREKNCREGKEINDEGDIHAARRRGKTLGMKAWKPIRKVENIAKHLKQ